MSFLDDATPPPAAPCPFISLYEIPMPIPITCSLMQVFGDPKRLPEETVSFLTAAKNCRDKIVTNIASMVTSGADIIIDTTQAYAKISVNLAVTQQAGLINGSFHTPTEEFIWTSSLSFGERGGNWSNPFGSFESLFAFVAAAAANTHKACELVFSDPTSPSFVEAGRLYRTAAGYLEYAVNNVVPTLRNRGTTVKYPAEVHTPVLQALMHTCLAQAQHCAILKAANEGKPRGTLAKLEMGVQSLYLDALRCLHALNPDDLNAVHPSFVNYVRGWSMLAGAMAAKHMGEEEYDKMEIAKALGYMNKAAGNFTRVGDLSFSARGPSGFSALRAQQAEIVKLAKVYLDDANNVYFVSESRDIPDAQVAVIVKTLPLEMPVPEPKALPPPLPSEAELKAAAATAPPPGPLAPSLSALIDPATVIPPGSGIGPGGYPLPASGPPPLVRTASAPVTSTPPPTSPSTAAGGPAPPSPAGPPRPSATGPPVVINCTGCRAPMQVPFGTPAVRCPHCSKITHMGKCKKCNGAFLYPEGTHMVQCPACKNVNDTRVK